jgi:ribosomal protein S1
VESSDVIIESVANHAKMDGIVTSVLRTGFFVDCGSLQAFVGRSVNSPYLHASTHH